MADGNLNAVLNTFYGFLFHLASNGSKGAFFNYVDKILVLFLTTYLHRDDICERIPLSADIKENLHTIDIS